jgi:hypothetical protein
MLCMRGPTSGAVDETQTEIFCYSTKRVPLWHEELLSLRLKLDLLEIRGLMRVQKAKVVRNSPCPMEQERFTETLLRKVPASARTGCPTIHHEATKQCELKIWARFAAI